MSVPDFYLSPQGRRLAFHARPGSQPGVVFLGGFKSDMNGTKALHLDEWASRTGRAFMRFDYSGHGESYGDFVDGAIGEWAEDALALIEAKTQGPQIFVGSSMGGWIALLLARSRPDRLAGLVTIAAAPDFTEDSMWAGFTETERATLLQDGQISLPSDYDEPYIITKRLIEDGRSHLVLRDTLCLPFPVRFLQGTADRDVDMTVALRLLAHIEAAEARLTLVKDADHRFSDPGCLTLIENTVEEVTRLGVG